MSKVVLLNVTDYNLEDVYENIKKGIELLGGIEAIIPQSKKVLLKPNLVVAIDPENAATTHPIVFEAVAKLLHEKEYQMTYGDSPGFGNPSKVAQKTGIKEKADKYNIPLADFVNGKKVSIPESVLCKQFDIANAVLETDAIINICKMKAHALQRITGAIKNPFGCVTGFNKGLMHSRFTNAYNFAEMLIDLDNYLKVDLHIMDGIVAMEGNGPRNGDPVKMNVLLISTDPVALDKVFCDLIDLNYAIIPTITYGQKYGLGSHDNIELLGDDITPLINKDFKIDRSVLKKQDSTSFSFLRKRVIRRPFIEEDICKKCGICIEVCPLEEKAVNWDNNNKSKPPIYDYEKCIRCYCCQEMCPYHVIKVKTPALGKALYGLKIIK